MLLKLVCRELNNGNENQKFVYYSTCSTAILAHFIHKIYFSELPFKNMILSGNEFTLLIIFINLF